MPSGLKRKFNPYQEPSSTMATRSTNPRVKCPEPTPETQAIYNEMRQEEERLTSESLVQMQTAHSGFLQAPSPSQATASSPSLSYASTTNSVSRRMDEMGVEDQPRVKKTKHGRQGPLPKRSKLRAALMRKLGACAECHGRRVRCTHFDLSKFEAAYQRTPRGVPKQPANADLHPGPARRPRLGDPVDLLGLEVGHNPLGYPALSSQGEIYGVPDEPQMDCDPLRNEQFRLRPELAVVISAVETPLTTPLINSGTQYLPMRTPQDNGEVQIGRQLSPVNRYWVCQWGPSGSVSALPCGESGFCNQVFDSLEALQRHYGALHAAFYDGHHVLDYLCCVNCQLSLSSQPDRDCPRCHHPVPFVEQASYWAKLLPPSGPPSLTFGRVASQDGSPSDRSSWASHSAQFPNQFAGYGNQYMPSYGSGYGCGNDGGGAGGQYYAGAPSTISTTLKESPAFNEKPSPAACHHVGSVTADMRCPASCLKRYSKKNSSARMALPACPVTIVLAVLVITLIIAWVPLGGLSRGASDVRLSMVRDSQLNIPDLSLAFIVVGMFAPWLFRHVRYWLRQSAAEAQHRERRRTVDAVGISLFEGARPRVVGVSAA